MENESSSRASTEHLGERAYALVREFSVRVGPRPAGGLIERSALEYAQSLLKPICTSVSRQSVEGILDASPGRPFFVLLLAGLLWAAWQTRSWPWAAPIYLFVFFVIPTIYESWRRRGADVVVGRSSFNLVGRQKRPERDRVTLVLGANVDSAQVGLVPGDVWPWLHRRLQSLWLPFTLVLCFLGLSRLADNYFDLLPSIFWDLAWVFPLAVAFVFVVYELFYFLVSRSKEYSPGANDNASGAAVVLAVAEYFHQHPPRAINLQYALFTAEEAGCLGARRYVKEDDTDPGRTYAIVLEMVGSGTKLRYARGLGLLPPRRTNKLLSDLLHATLPGVEGRWRLLGGTDLRPFLTRGIRATSLEAYGDPWRERVRHTRRDAIEYISQDALQLTAEAVVHTVELLDQRQALVFHRP